MKPYERHVGDTRTVLEAVIKQPNSLDVPTVVDLTDKTVQFKLVEFDGTVVVPATSTGVDVTDAVNGIVQYDFSSPGADTPGRFRGYFIVDEGGETDHFPVGQELIIEIIADA